MEVIWGLLKEKLGYEIPKTGSVLYLGNLTQANTRGGDGYLIRTLPVTRKKIRTRSWYNAEPPTKEPWLGVAEEIFDIERFTHILRL